MTSWFLRLMAVGFLIDLFGLVVLLSIHRLAHIQELLNILLVIIIFSLVLYLLDLRK